MTLRLACASGYCLNPYEETRPRVCRVHRYSDNWHHTITAAHSSPIYVMVNDELPAVRESAEYMVARMQATLRWAETDALWSSDQYKRKAISSFEQALAFYQSAKDRAR